MELLLISYVKLTFDVSALRFFYIIIVQNMTSFRIYKSSVFFFSQTEIYYFMYPYMQNLFFFLFKKRTINNLWRVNVKNENDDDRYKFRNALIIEHTRIHMEMLIKQGRFDILTSNIAYIR